MRGVMCCTDCRRDLDDTPVAEPCPECGGSRRSAAAAPGEARATVEVPSPRVTAESNFADGSKDTVVGSADVRSTTSRSSSGEPSHEFTGQPVRGESDVLQVCESLRGALKRRGITVVGKFRTPTGREGGIDAEGDAADGSVILVQVIGVIDQRTMAKLGREGRASSKRDFVELADEVCAAIEKKIGAYPRTQRSEVTLALDAIRSPGHAASEVVDALIGGPCTDIIRSSGFQAIWLVGPTVDLTHLLHG